LALAEVQLQDQGRSLTDAGQSKEAVVLE